MATKKGAKKTGKKTASAAAKEVKARTEEAALDEGVMELTAEAVYLRGIKTGEQAYSILRDVLERQDGQNAPGDDDLYLFCEAFKTLDEHMRTASGQGPKIWRNV